MVYDQEGVSQGIAPDDAGPGRASPPPLRGAGQLAAPMDEVKAAVAESARHRAEVGFDTEAAQGNSERLAQRPVKRLDRECRGVASGSTSERWSIPSPCGTAPPPLSRHSTASSAMSVGYWRSLKGVPVRSLKRRRQARQRNRS